MQVRGPATRAAVATATHTCGTVAAGPARTRCHSRRYMLGKAYAPRTPVAVRASPTRRRSGHSGSACPVACRLASTPRCRTGSETPTAIAAQPAAVHAAEPGRRADSPRHAPKPPGAPPVRIAQVESIRSPYAEECSVVKAEGPHVQSEHCQIRLPSDARARRWLRSSASAHSASLCRRRTSSCDASPTQG